MAFEKENVVRLYVENECGAHLEICPNPDAPDCGILIHTPDKQSEEWFGRVHLTLQPDEAQVLGEVLQSFKLKGE